MKLTSLVYYVSLLALSVALLVLAIDYAKPEAEVMEVANYSLKSTSLEQVENKICAPNVFLRRVEGKSMIPTMGEDNFVLWKPYESVAVGDIILFEKGNQTIAHRVIEINSDERGKYYTTKGDNNKKLDKLKVREVKGVVVGVIY